MRIRVAGILLLGLMAGCSSNRDSGQNPGAATSSPTGDSASSLRHSPGPVRSRAGFASLPDRGNLVAYDRTISAKESGAYTSYPVNLSEAHALRAIVEGEMVVTTPDGRQVRLGYERHVEHPDGNWSWIGRDNTGNDAVITFGEKSVFGAIPDGGREPLQLTVAGGRSWLVQTDRAKVPQFDTSRPDYLVPPDLTRALNSKPTVAAGLGADLLGAEPNAPIDVLLGYTSGFAMGLGGQSQAVTRLNNLVEITNQAYSNSAIGQRLRLVHTMQVDFPDATDNGEALQKLSGYQSGVGAVPVDPSFNALRAARDQYGADLVSLVRKFQSPQNSGCGIAWLIGGEQSAIDASAAPFGYSVISDGTDVNESDGLSYGCRQETLAHELGHNMGQAHNTEDSTTTGAHSYSYGYRETPAAGFYTVMAYRLPSSSQFAIRHFANPNVAYAGRPTGVADASDNTRSMNQTMPVIATFRAAAVSASGGVTDDINKDGKSDLIFRRGTALASWQMNGAGVASGAYLGDGAGFSVSATGDFDGNGAADFMWSNGSQLVAWLNNGAGGYQGALIAYYGDGWIPFAAGDVNKDGKSDLLFRKGESIAYWLLDGFRVIGSAYAGTGSGFAVVATGDYDGNGAVDLMWSNGSQLVAWLNNGSGGFQAAPIAFYGDGWIPFAAGDVNKDGKSDLLFRKGESIAYWLLDGPRVIGSAYAGTGSGFAVVATGDYDGNGAADLMWSNGSQLVAWLNNGGGGFQAASVGHYGDGWQPLMTPLFR